MTASLPAVRSYTTSRDMTVVTREVSRPKAQRANRKVPDVCDTMGVTWMDDFELWRRLDFRIE